ncbi:VOC family protein [Pseudolysinimonas sp.]|uniref:VOC family protein n=1 Tax=Pseudolysinimonas sp. TaxID=2680009 RepID=UPI003F808782
MHFASARVITDDVDRLVPFYEELLSVTADRPAPVFAVFRAPTGTLAIGSTATVPVVGFAERSGSVVVEFEVGSAGEVDAAFASLRALGATIVQEPTVMPWGNRSLLVEDPDGNLVNVFAPPAH